MRHPLDAKDGRRAKRYASRRYAQLVLKGVGVLAITVVLATVLIIVHQRQVAIEDDEAAIRTFDVVLAEHTARVFEGADHAISEVLQTLRAAGIESVEELRFRQAGPRVHDRLLLTMSGLPQVDAVFVVDKDGHTVSTSDPVRPKLLDISDRDYFLALRDHPELELYVSAPTVDRVRGTHVVFMARRLSTPDGSFLGIVVASIALGYFEDFFQAISPAEGHVFALFRKDGVLLTQYPEDSGLFVRPLKAISAFSAMLPNQEPQIVHVQDGSHPVPFILAGRPVPGFPLVASVVVTQSAVDGIWRSRAAITAIGGAIAALLVSLMGWLLLRQFMVAERIASMRGEVRRERDARRQVEDSEARLRQSQQHLDRAQKLGSIGSFELDFGNGRLSCSEQTYRIFGVDNDGSLSTADQMLLSVHEADRERVLALRRRIADGFDEESIDYRIIRADGTVRFVRSTAAANRDESGMVTGAIGTIQDITQITEAEEALRLSEQRFRHVAESMGEVFWLTDIAKTEMIFINAAYEKIWGRSCESLYAEPKSWMEAIHPDDRGRVRGAATTRQTIDAYDIEYRIVRPDGTVRWIHDSAFPVKEPGGQVMLIAGVAEDITARRELESQLRQAQKMQAIGTLTGGLAHDFNNLLGVILGNTGLLADLVQDDPAAAGLSDDVQQAALRGAELIRSLLAFARRQPLRPQPADLNELVGNLSKLLRRVLGEQIEFKLSLAPSLAPMVIDVAQLESAITNLATNARDAMPKGGRLTLATGAVTLGEHDISPDIEAVPGHYAVIEVGDTGDGMPPEIIEHIFEPFFTTKEEGRGSGLGLSMVFGFIKQSGGYVTVSSEPGRGTTFRLYLPYDELAGQTEAGAPGETAASRVPSDAGTILVVEDNDMMRDVVVKQITSLGYHVLMAESADAALSLIAGRQKIDLLFTDVVMPGTMDGLALAREAALRRPALKILLTSGFPETRSAESLQTYRLLDKPYRKEELARTLRETLDEPMMSPMGAAPPGTALRRN